MYEANRWWSYWKLQLYWHKLVWVNPRSKSKRKKNFSFSSIFYINKGDITSQWVGHSRI